ncbi:MAG: hypothetical protein MJ072_03700, partial [Clostridia bacterium]|nr:hypothetical protein [Clostridia bacterium]
MKKRALLLLIVCLVFAVMTAVGCADNTQQAGESVSTSASVSESKSESVSKKESASSSQKEKNEFTVKFETCTDLPTNMVFDQYVEKGGYVNDPVVVILGDNPDNLEVEGWYKDKRYTKPFDIYMDPVYEDMTLYAKWVEMRVVNFYLGADNKPIYRLLVANGNTVDLSVDLCEGYKFEGYYTSGDYTEEFDIERPILENTEVYIKRSEGLYLDAKTMAKNFVPKASGGTGATAGNVKYVENGADSYVECNFGYSMTADPYMNIASMYADHPFDISKSQKLRMTMRNLGGASSLRYYFVAKFADGSYADRQFYTQPCSGLYVFEPSEMNMKKTDEWITVEVDLA